MSRSRKIDDAEAMRLYRAGRYDREIAEALGVTKLAVLNWRKRNDLAAVERRPETQRPKLHWLTMDLYRATLRHTGGSYSKAAAMIGVSPATLRKWVQAA